MKYLTMHKVDEAMEKELPPDPQLMARMGAFMGEVGGSGKPLGGEGLQASRSRTRLTFRGATGVGAARDGAGYADTYLVTLEFIDADDLDRLIAAAEDLADLEAVRAARAEIADGESAIPWEQVKADLGLA